MKVAFLSFLLFFIFFQSLLSSESVNFKDKRDANNPKDGGKDQVEVEENQDVRKLIKRALQNLVPLRESSGNRNIEIDHNVNHIAAGGGEDFESQERTDSENALDAEILQLLETLNGLLFFKFQLANNVGEGLEEKIETNGKDEAFKTFNAISVFDLSTSNI